VSNDAKGWQISEQALPMFTNMKEPRTVRSIRPRAILTLGAFSSRLWQL